MKYAEINVDTKPSYRIGDASVTQRVKKSDNLPEIMTEKPRSLRERCEEALLKKTNLTMKESNGVLKKY